MTPLEIVGAALTAGFGLHVGKWFTDAIEQSITGALHGRFPEHVPCPLCRRKGPCGCMECPAPECVGARPIVGIYDPTAESPHPPMPPDVLEAAIAGPKEWECPRCGNAVLSFSLPLCCACSDGKTHEPMIRLDAPHEREDGTP